MITRLIRFLSLLVVLLLLCACYNSDREIFPASMGITTPYAYDSILFDDGATADLSREPYNNDYRFRMTSPDGSEVDTGTVRAVHIRDSVYLLQVKYDNESEYYLVFYDIRPDRIEPLEPADYAAVDALALKHNVTIEYDYATYIDGETNNIISFLRDHYQLAFKPREPLQ